MRWTGTAVKYTRCLKGAWALRFGGASARQCFVLGAAVPAPARRSAHGVEDADVRQIAVLFRVVEAVADDEAVVDCKADVVDLHVDQTP